MKSTIISLLDFRPFLYHKLCKIFSAPFRLSLDFRQIQPEASGDFSQFQVFLYAGITSLIMIVWMRGAVLHVAGTKMFFHRRVLLIDAPISVTLVERLCKNKIDLQESRLQDIVNLIVQGLR